MLPFPPNTPKRNRIEGALIKLRCDIYGKGRETDDAPSATRLAARNECFVSGHIPKGPNLLVGVEGDDGKTREYTFGRGGFRTASGIIFFTYLLLTPSASLEDELERGEQKPDFFDALKRGNPWAHALVLHFDRHREWPAGDKAFKTARELTFALGLPGGAFDE